MSVEKTYTIGDRTGTLNEFSQECCVTKNAMSGRVERFLKGKNRVEDVFKRGKIEPGKKNGNEAWQALPDPVVGRPKNLRKIKSPTEIDLKYARNERGWCMDASQINF